MRKAGGSPRLSLAEPRPSLPRSGESKEVDSEFTIGGQSSGPLTLRLRSALVDIQRGAAPDPYGWVEEVA